MKGKKLFLNFAIFLIFCLYSLRGEAQVFTGKANCKPQWRKRFKANFRDYGLPELIKWLSDRTCQNFILTRALRAQKITIVSEKSETLRTIYRAFLSALELSDITMIRIGKYWKLIPSRSGVHRPIKTYTNEKLPPPNEEMITYIIRVKYADPYKIYSILNQLSSPVGRRLIFAPAGVIIITDYASNVRRLVRIVNELDIPEAEEKDRMFLVELEYANAREIVEKVRSIFQILPRDQARNYRRRGQTVDESHRLSKILADERTNRIIIVSSNKAYLNAVKLIKKLDIPLTEGGAIRVHRLHYAKAEEIAQTLSQLARGGVSRRRRGRVPQSTDLFRGEVRITADKSTNSLIIVSNQRDYENLMRVIKKLDVRRKQVFVETVILEVSLDKSRELGAAFHGGALLGGDKQNPDFAIFGTRLGGLNSVILDPAALMGLALGLRGPDLPNTAGLLGPNTPGIPSFGVILRAIQSDSNVDIISTPHILTAANEEATIVVGQNVPFIAGTSFSAAGFGVSFPVRNIQRQDVALTMKIKPQINAGDRVKLELSLEVTEIISQDPELGPTTSKRRVKTTIRVKDNQTVVIGGLMRDRVTEGVSKVPILGDIPLIGSLFRVKNRQVEKRNLLIFLTPHIILNAQDFQRIFEQKMKERREFLERFYTLRKTRSLSKLMPLQFGSSRGFVDRVIYFKRELDSNDSKKAKEKSKKKKSQKPESGGSSKSEGESKAAGGDKSSGKSDKKGENGSS